ncbi:hypothetical protein GLYMA_05G103850v4 [Glycine max]|nr:hypothetical protein GLYMA_05G103850v4 [Glycine max]KAH1133725.1 hypothetical protein GYH30_012230 [Glycine max]
MRLHGWALSLVMSVWMVREGENGRSGEGMWKLREEEERVERDGGRQWFQWEHNSIY